MVSKLSLAAIAVSMCVSIGFANANNSSSVLILDAGAFSFENSAKNHGGSASAILGGGGGAEEGPNQTTYGDKSELGIALSAESLDLDNALRQVTGNIIDRVKVETEFSGGFQSAELKALNTMAIFDTSALVSFGGGIKWISLGNEYDVSTVVPTLNAEICAPFIFDKTSIFASGEVDLGLGNSVKTGLEFKTGIQYAINGTTGISLAAGMKKYDVKNDENFEVKFFGVNVKKAF